MSAFYAMSNNKQLLDEAKYDIKNYAWVSSKEQANVMKTVTSFFISYLMPLLYYTYIFLTPLCFCYFLRFWFHLSIKKQFKDLFHREALFNGKNNSDNKNTCYVHDLLA